MLSLYSKYLFAATSIAPVFLTLAVMALNKGEEKCMYAILALVFFFISLFLFIYVHIHITNEMAKTKISINSISQGNKEITGYFLTYLMPIIGSDILLSNMFMFLFFIFSLLLYTAYSTSFNFNPLLSICYRFYIASDTSGRTIILLTKKKRNGKRIDEIRTGYLINIPVIEITSYMYLMIGED